MAKIQASRHARHSSGRVLEMIDRLGSCASGGSEPGMPGTSSIEMLCSAGSFGCLRWQRLDERWPNLVVLTYNLSLPPETKFAPRNV